MIAFIENKKNYIMILAIMFVVISLSDTTYSLFVKEDKTEVITINTGLLELEITEDKKITLENAFPTIDSVGKTYEPYNLTIKNTGTVAYIFDLKMLSETNENTIDTKYIKVMVDDNLPKTLYSTSNVIVENAIVYPNEEKTYQIRVWLDNNTTNSELGKTFVAKFATTGESTYKTLDTSNANKPDLLDDMLPVLYDESTSSWIKADKNNIIEAYKWYDYNNSMWANVVNIKDTDKHIYDITGNHNIKIKSLDNNNSNAVLGNNYLDLGVKYNKNKLSTVLRFKIDNINESNIYLLSNDNLSLYYDTKDKNVVFKVNDKLIKKNYTIEESTWYILTYTYNSNKLSLYMNGEKILEESLTESLISSSSLKLGTNNTKDIISGITVGDIYIYNDILSSEEIQTNYKTSINIIYDSLEAGFNDFIPQTKKEYYESASLGTKVLSSDITNMYVWIPRFKYQVFNIKGDPTNISNNYQKGINIVFESDTSKTGSIFCEKYTCYSDNLKITKVTEADNGKYYTHPAFTNSTEEVTGFWIGKYELSSSNNTLYTDNNKEVLINTNLSTFYKLIKNNNNDTKYHMITNTEWAAVTYLSHSKYGLCKDNTCQELTPNKTFITGSELKDSTTQNMYGVFDMAGSAAEFVMANYAKEDGTINLENSNFNSVAISNKDYDLYMKDTFILGDATKEITNKISSWNNGVSTFLDETNNWFIRGGISIEENPTIYSYRSTSDEASEYITSRVTIK